MRTKEELKDRIDVTEKKLEVIKKRIETITDISRIQDLAEASHIGRESKDPRHPIWREVKGYTDKMKFLHKEQKVLEGILETLNWVLRKDIIQ
jgi:hypothetical protein